MNGPSNSHRETRTAVRRQKLLAPGWNQNMEIKEDALSAAVREVLDKDNYVAWSVQVKTYLMARDLWNTIEATTEPPKQEDDESAFKAWSKKNSIALHVIRVSCGPDALSMIGEIRSAKMAWNTLAENYNVPFNTNTVALRVLDIANYTDWSDRVQTYLMAHNLWDIIEADEVDEADEAASKARSTKNSMALHVIHISCGPDAFSEIIEISSAKIAWDTLAEKYNIPEKSNSVVLDVHRLSKDYSLGEVDRYKHWTLRVKTYLMAHDLWDIIEETDEPPRQEDDEAAFKAWRKKNFRALHAIKISCGRYTLSKIIKIKSAKVAWNTLAEMCMVPQHTESDVLEVLDKDNYMEWRVQVKAKLTTHGLWDIIEANTEPPMQEEDETAFQAWTEKNSMALHAIHISCGSDAFDHITGTSSAKIAWDTLANEYNLLRGTSGPSSLANEYNLLRSTSGPSSLANGYNLLRGTSVSGSCENGNDDYLQYKALKEAVEKGDWNAAEVFLMDRPDAAVAKITPFGHTALNVAVKAGHEHIVEMLVERMSEEDLALRNSSGHTALVAIINAGNYRMAASMLRKNRNLVSIKDSNQQIPVIQAISNGHIELARYLYSLTPFEDLTLEKGATLCTQAIYTGSLDIALDLTQKCPHLALARDDEGRSPLYALSDMPNAFPSGDGLVFWKRWIYNYCIHIQPARAIEDTETGRQIDQANITESGIHIQPARAIEETRLNVPNTETGHQIDQVKIIESVLALLRQLVSNILNFLGIKDLYEMKLLHVQSHDLLALFCKQVSISANKEQRDKGRVYDAIFRSIEKGNFEFIFHMVKANPELLWSRGEHLRSIFTFAVLHRQAKIFSLMYGLPVKNSMATSVDDKNNNILHMAGKMKDSILLNRIPGAALQMQRELQWFKEVESIAHPKVKESLNDDDLTPRQLFTKTHNNLKKEGEQWMKSTATSCTVVGALIITIMFAAAFTIPGGHNQDTGFPIFLNEKLFMVFIISDALSLFSSSTSVLMFLGILTSRYGEDDFLESLPRKMIIGLSTLFFSIATMMIAFSAALLIMLHLKSWIVIPVICLASVPITLFVLMQFPLLADMLISSYGRGIFNKKMERWVKLS